MKKKAFPRKGLFVTFLTKNASSVFPNYCTKKYYVTCTIMFPKLCQFELTFGIHVSIMWMLASAGANNMFDSNGDPVNSEEHSIYSSETHILIMFWFSMIKNTYTNYVFLISDSTCVGHHNSRNFHSREICLLSHSPCCA